MNIIKAAILLVWMGLISACASQIPPDIRQAPDSAPGVAQVHNDVTPYISQKVRWGGVIVQTENKDNASWVTLVAYPLNAWGEPISANQSPGRFIAITEQFLEPQVYSENREVTIVGRVLRTQTVQVDAFAYQYPVVQVEHIYLWPKQRDQRYTRRTAYSYDPWYYPYYAHPYRRHHFYYPYYLHRGHRHLY